MRKTFQAAAPALYAFSYLATGSREEARELVMTLARELEDTNAAIDHDGLVATLARWIAAERRARLTFAILDNLLRTDVTRELDAADPTATVGVEALAWELKRTCLSATLGCLPPAVRVTFLLTDVLGYAPERAAELLDIKLSAYRVRLGRARMRLDGFLGPRCGHVNRRNPCSCVGRLAVAAEAGFVDAPPERDVPEGANDAEPGYDDVVALYRRLPWVRLGSVDLECASRELQRPDDGTD